MRPDELCRAMGCGVEIEGVAEVTCGGRELSTLHGEKRQLVPDERLIELPLRKWTRYQLRQGSGGASRILVFVQHDERAQLPDLGEQSIREPVEQCVPG